MYFTVRSGNYFRLLDKRFLQENWTDNQSRRLGFTPFRQPGPDSSREDGPSCGDPRGVLRRSPIQRHRTAVLGDSCSADGRRCSRLPA